MTIPKQPSSRDQLPAGGVPPRTPRKAWLVALAVVAALAAFVAVALSVGDGGPKPNDHDSDVPSGEIWEWAIGRNLWTDPGLEAYAKDLGIDWGDPGTDANVHSHGFQLTADSSGTVTSVTLYNDESALGFQASESNFSAYQGSLPMGLTWNTTATDLGAVYGAENQSGGYGTDISFSYVTSDGDQVKVSFVARHERDLPGSAIHSITVTH